MAGDVNKLQPGFGSGGPISGAFDMKAEAAPAVTERSFDEYHLYTLERATTLYDREPSRWSSYGPQEFLHSGSTFTMASRSIRIIATIHGKPS